MTNVNVFVLTEQKILLYFNRKVASMSISTMVLNTLDYSNKLGKESYKFFFNGDINDYKDYHKIMIVRNPYKRIMSSYNDNLSFPIVYNAIRKFNGEKKIKRQKKVIRNITFEEYVNEICLINDNKSDKHFRSQTYEWNWFNPDTIIKLEDMKGWEELGLPSLKHLHYSKTKHIDNISESLKNKIYKRFRTDFKLLGYKKSV